MNCIIIEDQPPAQRILTKYISDLGTLSLVGTFPDVIQAMEFLKNARVDLIFLDLHLPKVSGMDFLKMMPQVPHVILTTAFPDYALESYEFAVVDYLLKPFSFQRFVKAVNKVPVQESSSSAPQTAVPDAPKKIEIFIKSGYDHIKIAVSDILSIRSDKDYTELFLPGRKLLSSEPLRYWEEQLPTGDFVRIHKSHIINLTKIEKISGLVVHLNDGIELPVGRAYKDQFFEKLKLSG